MEDRRWIVSTAIMAFLVMIVSTATMASEDRGWIASTSLSTENLNSAGRWESEGSPDESFSQFTGEVPYDWNNASLSWQRTTYHFQPKKNWMNDPCGPLYHMGWYHLFYQYNPESPLWGNITWGHAISRDLIHWYHLPLAMVRDSPLDNLGVYTGSATNLPDGRIGMLYTGSKGQPDNKTQVLNLAYPAHLSDDILLDWVKYPGNPVLVSPSDIDPDDFRDPTTGWLGPDGIWRVAIGARYKDTKTCAFLVYKTTNFTSYFSKRVLHEVPDLGMWECMDFYPISTTGSIGLDSSDIGLGIKHVLKASVGINKMTQDYYALGTYDWQNEKWIPDNPDVNLGFGSKIDYGTYYASKTFYDHIKKRRTQWGWIPEADSEDDKINKGWASVQSIPRVVTFDQKTKTGILQWPVEEVETMRSGAPIELEGVELKPHSVRPLDIGIAADQLDITADFEIDKEALEDTGDDDATYDCNSGAFKRGSFGPFGLIIGDKTLSELTPIYFYIAKANNGSLKIFFCADKTRSSKASSVDKQVYGAEVPVLDGEALSVRLLVNHSVVESFAQGGRRVITLRNYPTEAIYEESRLFLFNNAIRANVVASIKISKMESVSFEDYPSAWISDSTRPKKGKGKKMEWEKK